MHVVTFVLLRPRAYRAEPRTVALALGLVATVLQAHEAHRPLSPAAAEAVYELLFSVVDRHMEQVLGFFGFFFFFFVAFGVQRPLLFV